MYYSRKFATEPVSGAKGRGKRPGFNQLCQAVFHRKIDVVAAMAVDRIGRSLPDLVGFLDELKSVGCDLYLEKQAVDTTTPAGRAMFQMLGAFAEFEREMIRDRIMVGISRARAKGTHSGKPFGRPRIAPAKERAIRAALASGQMGMLRIAREHGVGSGTVQRIKREMKVAAVTG